MAQNELTGRHAGPGVDKLSKAAQAKLGPKKLERYKKRRKKRVDWMKLKGNRPGVSKKSKDKVKAMTPKHKARYKANRARRKNFMQKHELGYWESEKTVEREAIASENDLMSDPSYAAFQAQLGFDIAGVNSNLLSMTKGFAREVERRTPIFEDQRITAIREAGEKASARGMFRSGVRLDNELRAEKFAKEDKNKFMAQYGVGGELGAKAQANAATQISVLQNQAIEHGLSTASRLTAEDNADKYNQSKI